MGSNPTGRTPSDAKRIAADLLLLAEKVAAEIKPAEPRVHALCEVARGRSEMADGAGAMALIAAAQESMARIDDPDLQDSATAAVAACQAATGDISGARETVGSIQGSIHRSIAVLSIASKAAETGDMVTVHQCVDEMRDARWQFSVCMAVAYALAKSGEPEAEQFFLRAKQAADMVDKPRGRDLHYAQLVRAFTEADEMDRAEALLAEIETPETQCLAYATLAEALLRADRQDEAKAVLGKAAAIPSRIGERTGRESACLVLAAPLAKAGLDTLVSTVIGQIHRGDHRDMAWAMAATESARASRLQLAKSQADEIEQPAVRARAYCSILRLLEERDTDQKRREELLEAMREMSSHTRDATSMAKAQSYLASAQAWAQKWRDARSTLANVDDQFLAVHVLMTIGAARLQAGHDGFALKAFQEARALASRMTEDMGRPRVQRSLVEELCRVAKGLMTGRQASQ